MFGYLEVDILGMNIPFLKYRKIYFAISGILVLASVIFLILFGLNLGVDFVGGSLLEVEFKDKRPEISEIQEKLSPLNLGKLSIQFTNEKGIILTIKGKNISESLKEEVVLKLAEINQLEEKSDGFEAISSVIGQELKSKTKIIIILCLVIIVFYIAFAFRQVSRPIASWQYGLSSIFVLCHDVLIPLGIFSVLGKFYGAEINIPVICALLAIFGYSINNTVVVFDRVREHLLKKRDLTYELAVDRALNETLIRCLNTSLTTLFVLFSMLFLVGKDLKYFSLILILGIVFGTWSSLFLVTPMLVSWLKWKERKLSN